MRKLTVELSSHGDEAPDVPAKIEILDASLRVLHEKWGRARSRHEFSLDPGTYLVRASLASGRKLERLATVGNTKAMRCELPIYELSPHESHEWAYLTRPLGATEALLFDDDRFRGVWIRLWHRTRRGWSVVRRPAIDRLIPSLDGVTFRLRTVENRQYLLQAGGLGVPWKFSAVPSNQSSMVLIRPTEQSAAAAPDLDIVVSSFDWDVEALVAFLQRGNTDAGENFLEQTHLAWEFLYEKRESATRAAVGAYFLLRIDALGTRYPWAENLANWFEWLADGAVIAASQLLREARKKPDSRDTLNAEARKKLLLAVKRGLPVYTEGLRLLREGLLFLHRRDPEDGEVRSALETVSEYASIVDWSVVTTTFTGAHPDRPAPAPSPRVLPTSVRAPVGLPDDTAPCWFVFDAPLEAALATGDLVPGDELVPMDRSSDVTLRVGPRGRLETADGNAFRDLRDAHVALHVPPDTWRVARTGKPLERTLRRMLLTEPTLGRGFVRQDATEIPALLAQLVGFTMSELWERLGPQKGRFRVGQLAGDAPLYAVRSWFQSSFLPSYRKHRGVPVDDALADLADPQVTSDVEKLREIYDYLGTMWPQIADAETILTIALLIHAAAHARASRQGLA